MTVIIYSIIQLHHRENNVKINSFMKTNGLFEIKNLLKIYEQRFLIDTLMK